MIQYYFKFKFLKVLTVVEYFPNLEQLKVCFNQIRQVETLNENMINNLKILDLESNPIQNWKHVMKFGELKKWIILKTINKKYIFDKFIISV